MKQTIFLLAFIFIFFQDPMLGARYSNGGVELVKFMTLENSFCKTRIYHEYNKYDEINKYLKVSFQIYPKFIQKQIGLRLKEESFQSRQRELEIQIISDKTLNSRVIGRYGLLLPVDGLYDSKTRTIYISKDYDIRTIVHEYFHFLRDISGIVIEADIEERLADQFSEHVLDSISPDGTVRTMLASQQS